MSEGVKQRFIYRTVYEETPGQDHASQLDAFRARYKDVSPAPHLVNVRVGKRLFCMGKFKRKIATRSWPAPVPKKE